MSARVGVDLAGVAGQTAGVAPDGAARCVHPHQAEAVTAAFLGGVHRGAHLLHLGIKEKAAAAANKALVEKATCQMLNRQQPGESPTA
ncbi:hypothetical protein GCM10010431_33880 [Streptomyces kunmingensis]